MYKSFGCSPIARDNLWPRDVSDLLQTCDGIIAFDAVLCRHHSTDLSNFDPTPRIAVVRLAGCQSCGSCPEGPALPGVAPESHLPLLSPPPLHSSSVKAAQTMNVQGATYAPLVVRCLNCLQNRWCERCNAWWCESCYVVERTKKTAGSEGASTWPAPTAHEHSKVRVHNGLCVSKCLINELLVGSGEGGMWG